jgi:ribosome-binding factor A
MRPRAKLVLKATGFFRDPFREASKLKTVPELCFYPGASMHRYVQQRTALFKAF